MLAADRLGAFSGVHRAARAAYQFDRTRLWLEPLINAAPAGVDRELLAGDQHAKCSRSTSCASSKRPISPRQPMRRLISPASVDRSLLPEIIRLARSGEHSDSRSSACSGGRLADGPPPQSAALKKYADDLKDYLIAHGAYFYDDWGDPDEPLSLYADGDHLTADGRIRYTERFAEKHARFFQ